MYFVSLSHLFSSFNSRPDYPYFLQGEGVAYRGRVLVELDTALGSDEIDNEVSTIENEDVIRVQVITKIFFP